MLALLAAKGVFYLVLAVHFLHYRALTGRADSRLLAACAPIFGTFGSYEALLDARVKQIAWAHVAIVFPSMLLTQYASGEHPLHYLWGSVVVWAIYNGGKLRTRSKWTSLLWINVHHLGFVIAFAYQSTEEPTRAWHNTAYFTWVWIIHSFGFLQERLLPMLGLPKGDKHGLQYRVMTVVRYMYGAVSVALFRGYCMGDGMPGFGLNYQTAALLGMAVGRLLANDNYVHIPFFKWVEAPGYAAVSLWHLLAQERHALAAATALVVALHIRKGVLLGRRAPRAAPAPLPSDPAAAQLRLVPREAPSSVGASALVFAHAKALRAREEAALVLSSHPGQAVVSWCSEPHAPVTHGSDSWLATGLGVGSADKALSAVLDEEGFLRRAHDCGGVFDVPASTQRHVFDTPSASASRLFDRTWWTHDTLANVNLISDQFSEARSRQQGGGRTFVCNDDGTISPEYAPQLVLGVRVKNGVKGE